MLPQASGKRGNMTISDNQLRGFSFRKQRRLLLAAGKGGCVLTEFGKSPITFANRTEGDAANNEAFARQAAITKAERERAAEFELKG